MKNPIALNNNKNTQVSPLFLLHEIIGSTHYYHPLAARLEDKMPVYGLELLNSGICLKDLTMRKLASEYVKLIKTVQSSGPYRLAGWSAGGLFAYEIAYQLIAVAKKRR